MAPSGRPQVGRQPPAADACLSGARLGPAPAGAGEWFPPAGFVLPGPGLTGARPRFPPPLPWSAGAAAGPARNTRSAGKALASLHLVLGCLEDHRDLGRAACVNQLLSQAVAPFAPALFEHAQRGDAGRVRELLARPSAREGLAATHGPRKRTALHAAAASGASEVISALIEAGAPIDPQDADGKTPVMLAAERGLQEAAALLHALGAAVDASDEAWAKMLVDAVCDGDFDAAYVLLSLGVPADPPGDEVTPLMRAALRGRDEVAALLLEHGAEAGATPGDISALHFACGIRCFYEREAEGEYPDANHAAVVHLLLEAGVDPNIASFNDITPLIFAAETGRAAVVATLLAHPGIDIDVAPPRRPDFTALCMRRPWGRSWYWGCCLTLAQRSTWPPSLGSPPSCMHLV